MDDPGWSWPAWKFDMKREDLTTTLHEQYNTFPSTIQDPEAFHHDVFELSVTASTADEFHSLLAARKQQRLQELNESLESAAFEIIAHPRLVGTEQWQYALQLFRTRSLDSLVRYFSSYLPDSYTDRYRSNCGSHTPLSTASSFADYSSVDAASTDASSVDADDDNDDDDDSHDHVPTFLSKGSDKGVFTQEPEDIHNSAVSSIDTHLPLTPRSITIDSDSAAGATVDTHSRSFPSSRDESTMASASRSIHDLDSYHTAEDINSPATSDADLSDSRSSVDSITFSGSESGSRNSRAFFDEEEEEEEEEDGYFPTTQLPMEDGAFDLYPDAHAQTDRSPTLFPYYYRLETYQPISHTLISDDAVKRMPESSGGESSAMQQEDTGGV
ncbi:uncharacterized protein DNG_05056 [Cephalotrichum gorgonifer]|uniref:Uncharacterized protein n=1 Tax=Cephalotrichum gorgonifer TaxID=2041049 RepID=A0AAE8SV53_9PEZI|nr:uncharacterized protein DNG_05056 [Cephalotrichum gorgonifer]